MSKTNAQMIALAGAAALAGLGYTLARRSDSRAARFKRASSGAPRRGESRPMPVGAVAANDPAPWQDSERISSAPETLDALDLALDLDGVFDGESASGEELTARPNQRVPAPHAGDDEDAPAPEDLGRAWLLQATESERSLGTADTLPEIENVRARESF